MFDSKPIASIHPQSVGAATTNGAGVDASGFSAVFGAFFLGAIDGVTALKVQESDDDSTWTDVSGASFTTLPGATDDNKVWTVSIAKKGGRMRYYRWSATTGGTANLICGTFFLGEAAEAGYDSTFYGSGSHLNVG